MTRVTQMKRKAVRSPKKVKMATVSRQAQMMAKKSRANKKKVQKSRSQRSPCSTSSTSIWIARLT